MYPANKRGLFYTLLQFFLCKLTYRRVAESLFSDEGIVRTDPPSLWLCFCLLSLTRYMQQVVGPHNQSAVFADEEPG